MTKPPTIEHTSRQIIEHRLLTALSEDDQVAILATREDLKILIAALLGYKVSCFSDEDRRKELGKDLQRLLKEAFGE